MLDESKLENRFVAAALKLAAERPWTEVSLQDIAERAGASLAELRKAFPSKSAILASFIRSVDDAVLARAPKPAPGEPARDRLFDVIMSRFDVLAPYKPGLKSIAAARPFDLDILCKAVASQAWMLNAAGIATDGPLGPVRVAGMGTVYASVFQTWLDDEDPGLARTMAALDRRLKRAEQAMITLKDVCKVACRLVEGLRKGASARQETAGSAGPTSGDDGGGAPIGYGRA